MNDTKTTDSAPQTTTSGNSQTATTHDIAAEEVSRADRRPWEVTAYNQVRRKFEPTSLTDTWARRMVDAAQAFDGMPGHLSDLVNDIDPATYREVKARVAQTVEQERGGKK